MSVPLIDIYQFRTFYTFDGLEHVLQAYAKPLDFSEPAGQTLGNYTIVLKDGSNSDFNTLDEDYYDVIQGFFADETAFSRVELWKIPANSQNAVFLSSKSLGGTGSVTAIPNVPASQAIFTARSTTGRTMRWQFEECVISPAGQAAWDAGGALATALLNYVSLTNSWQCERAGGYFMAAMGQFPGQSEAIFKRRYRPN